MTIKSHPIKLQMFIFITNLENLHFISALFLINKPKRIFVLIFYFLMTHTVFFQNLKHQQTGIKNFLIINLRDVIFRTYTFLFFRLELLTKFIPSLKYDIQVRYAFECSFQVNKVCLLFIFNKYSMLFQFCKYISTIQQTFFIRLTVIQLHLNNFKLHAIITFAHLLFSLVDNVYLTQFLVINFMSLYPKLYEEQIMIYMKPGFRL